MPTGAASITKRFQIEPRMDPSDSDIRDVMSEEAQETPHDETVVAAFDEAQRQTIAMTRKILADLRPGQTQADIVALAQAAAPTFGFSGWFQPPHVRFGAPRNPPRRLEKSVLEPGMLVEIDLAPHTDQAFGDFGYAFAFQTDEEPKILTQARELCRAACGFSNRFKCTGEVYVFSQAWAVNRSLSLGKAKSVGHRCFAPQGRMALQWPMLARAAILMRRNQVEWFNHRRMSGLYALQPRLVSDTQGLAFEEMVLVLDHGQRVMGRESLDEVGTL